MFIQSCSVLFTNCFSSRLESQWVRAPNLVLTHPHLISRTLPLGGPQSSVILVLVLENLTSSSGYLRCVCMWARARTPLPQLKNYLSCLTISTVDMLKTRTLEAGELSQWLATLVALSEDSGQFLAPT